MRHYPGQGEAVQTTSNVKDREALRAWRQRSLDDQNRAIATLRAAFNQRMAGLLTADAAKTAAAVIKKYTTAWDQSLVNTLGDPQEMQQTKRRLRVAAHEALRGELPIHDAVKALQQKYSLLRFDRSEGGVGRTSERGCSGPELSPRHRALASYQKDLFWYQCSRSRRGP